MWNSPQEAFSEFVVHTALESMDNPTKTALSRGINAWRWHIEIEKKNVCRALDVFLWQNPEFQDQIKITPTTLKHITCRLTDTILNEWRALWTADAVTRNAALFISWEVMDYA
jgi:predicted metal-dependent hydrolase